jgi:alcohol dehydrogenase
MRAVVLQDITDVSVEDVPDPTLPGPEGIVVGVERAAICGSDLHLYHGAIPGQQIRLGHEAIGTVLEAGPDVRSVSVGDRVLVSGVVGCGRCGRCLAGDPARCATGQIGVFGTGPELPGGQAEAIAVPMADRFVAAIPDGIDVDQALLLTDILPTAYLAASRAAIAPGSTVAVIGLGPVGFLALRCAQLFGPARLLAVDRVPERLAHAQRIGAEPLDARDGGIVEAVFEATSGQGASSVIEAIGADETIIDAVQCAALGGTVSVVGVNLNPALPFPMMQAFLRSLTVRMTLASIPKTWEPLIALLHSGRLDTSDVFTHHLGLSEAPAAYELFDAKADGVLKVTLDPSR